MLNLVNGFHFDGVYKLTTKRYNRDQPKMITILGLVSLFNHIGKQTKDDTSVIIHYPITP